MDSLEVGERRTTLSVKRRRDCWGIAVVVRDNRARTMRRHSSAKSDRRGRAKKKPEKPLDSISTPRRGRPRKTWEDPQATVMRADNLRSALKSIWSDMGTALVQATTETEIVRAWNSSHWPSGYLQLPRPEDLARRVLALRATTRFPKGVTAQINFMADSLACHEGVSARTCRDLCGKERRRQERLRESNRAQGTILRVEWYVECSCGYRGPAKDGACRKCRALIPVDPR